MSTAVDVRLIRDEADAVLEILAKRGAGQAVEESDWERLLASEGYVRLKRREAEMGTSFEDDEFRAFVLSEELLGRAATLEKTVDGWCGADVTGAAERALAYLPEGAQVRAKIYPVIKPKENSFVFELETDPAIFLYVDPTKNRAQFENMLAHELHHVGYTSSCPSKQASKELAELPRRIRAVVDWTTAFGEGVAMLAAAGGPDIHPHATSDSDDRARWDRDMENLDADLKKLEGFFHDILANRFKTEDEVRAAGFSFFGVQGPWYTVGWKMAATIEEVYGRGRLIECLCDPRKLLPTYNEAAERHNRSARKPLALWSSSVVDAIQLAAG